MINSYEEEDDDFGLELLLYTEKATSYIYEVQFFEDFALIRPAAPAFREAIERVDIHRFAEAFEEFAGDHAKLKAFIYHGIPYGM